MIQFPFYRDVNNTSFNLNLIDQFNTVFLNATKFFRDEKHPHTIFKVILEGIMP